MDEFWLLLSTLGQTGESIDVQLAAFFHARSNDPYFVTWEFLSNIGHGRCVGIILGALLLILALKRHWHSVAAVFLTVPGMYLGELVKVLVQRARPDPYVEDGYSFPSGHAITAALAYGMILFLAMPYLKTKRVKIIACLVTVGLVFVVSFARVALGAHYFSDVVVSIIFGAMWLGVCLKFRELLQRRFDPLGVRWGKLPAVVASGAGVLAPVAEAVPQAVAGEKAALE